MGAYPSRTNASFQSTPGRSAGRIAATCAVDALLACFNPRPAARPGESVERTRCWRFAAVSIHARPLGRANRNVRVGVLNLALMFQSTPGRSAGRIAGARVLIPPPTIVSIHARPLGRANLRGGAMMEPLLDVSIHARPLGRANLELVSCHREEFDVSIHARPLGRANRGRTI
uniref:Uncharacterized protein n=1 Tax=mine drainage metagenome TaxID=410659 RepID=E6PG38_9ZZZZ